MRYMPPEWHPHERTWVAFPHHGYTLGDTEAEQLAARKTWAEVANRASDYEPVTVVVHPAGVKDAKKHLSSQIEIAEIELDDAWLRDSGPTFVV